MTAEEAYKILSIEHPMMRIRSCLDFGSFFAFCLAPINVKDTDEYMIGTCMDAVDKKTGRTFIYDITTDYQAYEKAKEVKVKTIYNKSI